MQEGDKSTFSQKYSFPNVQSFTPSPTYSENIMSYDATVAEKMIERPSNI